MDVSRTYSSYVSKTGRPCERIATTSRGNPDGVHAPERHTAIRFAEPRGEAIAKEHKTEAVRLDRGGKAHRGKIAGIEYGYVRQSITVDQHIPPAAIERAERRALDPVGEV